MPATSVKTFYSTNGNAPVLHGNPGSMIAVLDACLKDGFNLKTLDSLVVAGGVATATVSAGHGYSLYQVATLSGATPSGLNGDFRITFASATQFKFACPGVSDGTASGTITAKLTPLGWVKPFSGTNLAAYKSNDSQSTGMILRVDDTGGTARIARVVGCESMTDLSTYTGVFPTAAQQAGGLYWGKSTAADAGARAWMLFGDERLFYLWVAPSTTQSNTNAVVHAFGDLIPQSTVDQFCCAIHGSASDLTGSTSDNSSCVAYSTASIGSYSPRNYTQLGSASALMRWGMYNLAANYSGGVNYTQSTLITSALNAIDNALLVGQVMAFDIASPRGLRGTYPGFYHSPGNLLAGVLTHLDLYSNLDAMPGKTLLGFKVGAAAASGTNNMGYAFVDPIGPWRT